MFRRTARARAGERSDRGHIGLDEWDDAFQWLDRAVETRDPLVMPIKTYPFLDPVRTDARYHALLRKMNLE